MITDKKEAEGFLLIDKPCGPSSFSVVAAVRRALATRKTGHAGTLDPGASGLLVLAIGSCTRLLPYLPLEPKVYEFGIRFGYETATLDSEGTVIKSGGRIPHVKEIDDLLSGFIGIQRQTPPQFSAIKVGGRRSYDLARKGETVELAAREIQIHSLRLLGFDEHEGIAALEVTCSGGTYVRSLARDIALKLGTFGYASSIRRISAGRFSVDRALTFDKVAEAEHSLIKAREVLIDQPGITLNDAQMARLATGSDVLCEQLSEDKLPELLFAYDNSDGLAAVLKQVDGKRYHPEKVFLK
jgi:tRNA pseudouridine55 synthase